ncbi:MAG: twin-arginine translocase TatA/TatE family subunit [Chloroflexi bacterium]|nr:twin-arginine translocase TatA/TatE family subunit [Chloroflexota bacterium]
MDLGIGFPEIALVLIIAFLIFGPGRMVEVARTLGRLTRSLKKATSDFTTAMTKEIDLQQLQEQEKRRQPGLSASTTAKPSADTQTPNGTEGSEGITGHE